MGDDAQVADLGGLAGEIADDDVEGQGVAEVELGGPPQRRPVDRPLHLQELLRSFELGAEQAQRAGLGQTRLWIGQRQEPLQRDRPTGDEEPLPLLPRQLLHPPKLQRRLHVRRGDLGAEEPAERRIAVPLPVRHAEPVPGVGAVQRQFDVDQRTAPLRRIHPLAQGAAQGMHPRHQRVGDRPEVRLLQQLAQPDLAQHPARIDRGQDLVFGPAGVPAPDDGADVLQIVAQQHHFDLPAGRPVGEAQDPARDVVEVLGQSLVHGPRAAEAAEGFRELQIIRRIRQRLDERIEVRGLQELLHAALGEEARLHHLHAGVDVRKIPHGTATRLQRYPPYLPHSVSATREIRAARARLSRLASVFSTMIRRSRVVNRTPPITSGVSRISTDRPIALAVS